MNPHFLFPEESMLTLKELRTDRRITKAVYDAFRNRLKAGQAQEVNLELYRPEAISSRRFTVIERAIKRDLDLTAATEEVKPVAKAIRHKLVPPSAERKAA